MLGNSTIRYICDTHNLNIICIISYFNIFSFFRELFPLQQNIAIILISLHCTAGLSRCLLFDIYNTFVVFTTDKPRPFTVDIWLHCIIRKQYEQTLCFCDLQTKRWVQFIDISPLLFFYRIKNISRKK